MIAFFFHNADQQDDADDRNDAEVDFEKHERKHGAGTG